MCLPKIAGNGRGIRGKCLVRAPSPSAVGAIWKSYSGRAKPTQLGGKRKGMGPEGGIAIACGVCFLSCEGKIKQGS